MCYKVYGTGIHKLCRKPFPSSFIWKTEIPPPNIRSSKTLPVKKYGMGLQNHVTSAKEKCTSLISAIGYLIGIVTGKQVFPTADHIRVVKGERRDKEIMGYHK